MSSITILPKSTFSGCSPHLLLHTAAMEMNLDMPTFMDTDDEKDPTSRGSSGQQEGELAQRRLPGGEAAAKSPRKGTGAGRQLPPHLAAAAAGPRERNLVRPDPQNNPELMQALIQVALEARQDTREIRAMLEWTVLLPGLLFFVTEGLDEGKRYALEASQKRGQDIGSSHIRIAIKTLAALPKTPELKEARELFQALQEFWDKIIKAFDHKELQHFIQVFKISKPKKASMNIIDGGYAKLTFRFTPTTPLFEVSRHAEALLTALIRCFKALNYQVKAGTPPRSYAERRLRELTRRL